MGHTVGGDEIHGNKYEWSGNLPNATFNINSGLHPVPAGASPSPHTFLSYAWGDDQPFVERLQDRLIKAGFNIWRDVEDLPSRGNSLRLELREALDAADRFVPICGPAAAASANVQLEWAFARDRCLPITPVLRLGDADVLPADFRRPLYFDFRDDDAFESQLAALIERLRAAPKRPGRLHGAFRLLPEGAIARPQSAQLTELLRPGETARALTGRAAAGALVAAGGMGKSVVALMFMLNCDTRRAFPDGLFWLEFGQSPTVVALQAQVGVALGDDVAKYRDVATGKARLQGLLQERKALLVLDDVWDAAQAEALLVHAPDCRWLITSRQTNLGHRLGLPPGHTLRVDRLSSDEGAALIAGRLGLAAGETHPDEAQHRKLVAVLDGHAQAIALAAAHLVAGDDELYLGPDELLRRYKAAQAGDNPFALLALSNDDRQQNLELSLQVSYNHLDENGQRRFRALGVFAAEGSFSTTALAAVWREADPDTAADAARFMAGASLLERADKGRWRQHALLRAYALALLRRAGEEDAARARHFAYYAAEYGDAERNHSEASPGRHVQITVDMENILHALDWGLKASQKVACDLVIALTNSYMQFRQSPTVQRQLLDWTSAVARHIGYVPRLADALWGLGDLDRKSSEYTRAQAYIEEALTLYQTLLDRLGEGRCLVVLGDLASLLGQYKVARDKYKAALKIFRKIQNRLGVANALGVLGDLEIREARYASAKRWLTKALGLYQGLPNLVGEANTLRSLGDLAIRQGQHGLARECYDNALNVYKYISFSLGEANTQRVLGDLDVMEDDYISARGRYGMALSTYEELNVRLGKATIWRALGELDVREDNYELARGHYEEALSLFEDIADPLNRANTLRSLANLDVKEALYASARERYDKALDLFIAISDRLGEANTFKDLGDLDILEGFYDLARAKFESALALFKVIPDRLGEANIYQALGRLSQMEGNLDGATQLYSFAMHIYQELGLKRQQMIMIVIDSQLRFAYGRVDEAIDLVDSALNYFETHGMRADARMARILLTRFNADHSDLKEH